MKAFLNDKKVQEKFLKRINAHAKADEFIRGSYVNLDEHGQFKKGCAVGCTIHSGNHMAYEIELGIPIWMAKIEDRIFEGISQERSKTWPVEFLEAINLGSDLQKIFIPMLIFIVESAREKTQNEKSLNAIDGVLKELKRKKIDYQKLREARADAAAADAADAAYAAAAAAAYAADAAYADAAYADAAAAAAADAAADAAYAAADAAYAAYAAAAYAARRKEYEKFADKLLSLIRECK